MTNWSPDSEGLVFTSPIEIRQMVKINMEVGLGTRSEEGFERDEMILTA